MDTSHFNKEGRYRSAVGTDELSGIGEIQLPEEKIQGLQDFEEGDEADISMKVRFGARGEDGKRSATILTGSCEPMPADAKKYRQESRSSMPPSTTLEEGE